ncbi:MAG: topoisomerase IV [Clostridiaceae bacterium]|nr:topoisomerase IV [Clostridiaceae bacterium]
MEEPYMSQEKITETLEKNYMPYAMSVIVSRAIPEIDGFKPAHRKLLYTMYKMGLLNGRRTKSANVVGQTMKLNPHGDQAIYDTMVRMTRGNGALLYPYVDSKGNFGKQFSRDMQCAAPRYTEVALEPFCREIFSGIEKDTVDMVDNYDGTLQEPWLLPVTFPSILVNANQGIAVGMASNICSFNLGEVCRATVAFIKDGTADLLKWMPAPDFSGGAFLIYDEDQMRQIFDKGRGSFKLRARYNYDKKNHLIEVTEIPYTTTIEQIIDDIAKLVKNGKIKEISDVRDETDLKGLKITIDLKRQADPEQLMQKLYAQTNLESSFACNFNVLVNGTPRVLGVRGLIAEWLVFRRQCVRREINFDLANKQNRLHLLNGLASILLDIDKAIRIIRETDTDADVIPNLCAGFNIDEVQAEYVAEIKLRNLNREYILKRTADIKKLKQEIRELKKKLKDPSLIDADIIEKLEYVAETYGEPRRTELIQAEKVEVLTEEDMIEDFNLKVFLTEEGYFKKLALTSLRSAGELKTKDGDQIVQELEGTNRMEIIFLTDQQNAYKAFLHEFEDQKPSDLGAYLPVELEMEEDEQVLYMLLPGDDYKGSLLFAFENGKVARVPLDSYQTKTRRRRLINAYSDRSPLRGVICLKPDEDGNTDDIEQDCFLVSDSKAVLLASDLLNEKTTRTTQGVQVLSGKKRGKISVFRPATDVRIEDIEYYRIRKIPSVGYYLKEKTLAFRQIGLGTD